MGRIKEDRIRYEETHFTDLVDGFIDKFENEFNDFVDDKYQNYLESDDFEADRQCDEERLNAVDLSDVTGSNQENFCN